MHLVDGLASPRMASVHSAGWVEGGVANDRLFKNDENCMQITKISF